MNNRTYDPNDPRVRVGHLEKEVGLVKGEINNLNMAMTAHSAKLTGVQEQIGNVARYLEKMADRVHEPKHMNWGWVIAAVMGFIALTGGFTTVVVEPMKHRTEIQRMEINDLRREALTVDRRLSKIEGQLEVQ